MTDGWSITAAIGTILAALVPAVLFFVERRDRKKAQADLAAELRHQAEQEQLRSEEKTMTEARRVAVWNETDGQGSPATLHVLNGSSDPVYDVFAFTQPMKPFPDELGHIGVGHWKVLMPGEHVTKSTRQAAPMPAWVEFTDVKQRQWTRRNNGNVEPGRPFY